MKVTQIEADMIELLMGIRHELWLEIKPEVGTLSRAELDEWEKQVDRGGIDPDKPVRNTSISDFIVHHMTDLAGAASHFKVDNEIPPFIIELLNNASLTRREHVMKWMLENREKHKPLIQYILIKEALVSVMNRFVQDDKGSDEGGSYCHPS